MDKAHRGYAYMQIKPVKTCLICKPYFYYWYSTSYKYILIYIIGKL